VITSRAAWQLGPTRADVVTLICVTWCHGQSAQQESQGHDTAEQTKSGKNRAKPFHRHPPLHRPCTAGGERLKESVRGWGNSRHSVCAASIHRSHRTGEYAVVRAFELLKSGSKHIARLKLGMNWPQAVWRKDEVERSHWCFGSSYAGYCWNPRLLQWEQLPTQWKPRHPMPVNWSRQVVFVLQSRVKFGCGKSPRVVVRVKLLTIARQMTTYGQTRYHTALNSLWSWAISVARNLPSQVTSSELASQKKGIDKWLAES